MIIRAVLLDDEQENNTGLQLKLAAACPEVEVVASLTDPKKALQMLHEADIDVLFLDVEMPEMNGFTLLGALPNRHFDVVMVTAYSEYSLKAIKSSALDYLLKPVDNDELRDAVNKLVLKKEKAKDIDKKIEELSAILKTGNQQQDKIALHSAREVHFVPLSQIIRISGENNYSIFHLVNGTKITVTKTLKEYEDLLGRQHFFRIHKSDIINLNYLVKLNKVEFNYVVMSDGSEIEISVRRKAEFLKVMEGLAG